MCQGLANKDQPLDTAGVVCKCWCGPRLSPDHGIALYFAAAFRRPPSDGPSYNRYRGLFFGRHQEGNLGASPEPRTVTWRNSGRNRAPFPRFTPNLLRVTVGDHFESYLLGNPPPPQRTRNVNN